MKRLWVFLFSATMLFTAQYALANTEVSGFISENTSWTQANSPYIVTGNILVNEGVTLNIEAGVTVKLATEKVLQVKGELIARGTNASQIIFTSNQSTPAAGDWGWILFADTSTDASYDEDGNYTDGSILEYCVIEYGGGGESIFSDNAHGSICVDNAYPFINHCVVQNNSASGIKAYNYPSEGEIRIYNSTFSNNASADEGGGISLSYTIFEIKNTIVSNNISYLFGGGIFIYKGSGTISDSFVSNNVITSGHAGGGIYAVGDGEFVIVNNTIRYNIAGDGGGICFGGSGTITNNHIHNNIANSSGAGRGGGGILISVEDKQVTVSTNVIEDNNAENGSAIKAWAMGSAKVEVKYNQIIKHTAASSTIYVENHVWDYDNPESSFNYNNIYNNTTTYELFNNSDSTSPNLNAKHNYWGTTDESDIQTKIYDWFDDGSKGIVEYQPIATQLVAAPTASTGSATSVASNSATLNGTVNPNGRETSYYFEYGTTTSYGSTTTSTSAGSGISGVSVNAPITGLITNIAYHYRLAATNSAGTTYGDDQTFTTSTTGISAVYFPHIASHIGTWKTEICVINTSVQTVNGVFKAYSNTGVLVSEIDNVTLTPHGRREITVGDEFSSPANIGYIVFESHSDAVVGYTKFYIEGLYRVAVPAVPDSEINTGDIYISHIASGGSAQQPWYTGVSLLNTTSSSKTLTIEFDNDETKTVELPANEHKAFTIRSLFGGEAQPGIKSGVIKDASGVIGLELFTNNARKQMSGILLKDDTTQNIYYPHIASENGWVTSIVAYNPSDTSCDMTITPYTAEGDALTTMEVPIGGKGKYIGTVAGLGLPTDTAWFQIDATSPITGFELFTKANQLGGYTGVGISGTEDVFAKLEKDGYTGIAFVNIENSSATVTLTAYDDIGTEIATEVITLDAHEKVVSSAEGIFTEDISNATYIAYSSDKEVVGFQLNTSSDLMMMDGLPGM